MAISKPLVTFSYKRLVLRSALEVEKDLAVEVDAGLLAVTDLNHIDAESYTSVLALSV